MWQIIKRLMDDDAFFYTVLILLVGVGSFGLGRVSVLEEQSVPVPSQTEDKKEQHESDFTPNTQVVVSKSGTKYHALWCPGANTIKEENKVYYDTPAEAEAAGYTLAANCSLSK